MPTSADPGPELLVDTSVAVALSVADHGGRAASRAVVEGRRLGLAGHAAFESFSVLTRLPAPMRRTPAAVSRSEPPRSSTAFRSSPATAGRSAPTGPSTSR